MIVFFQVSLGKNGCILSSKFDISKKLVIRKVKKISSLRGLELPILRLLRLRCTRCATLNLS